MSKNNNQYFGFWALDFGFWISFGFWILDLFVILDFGF